MLTWLLATPLYYNTFRTLPWKTTRRRSFELGKRLQVFDCTIQKQPLEVFCEKKVLLQISNNSHLCQQASFLTKFQAKGSNFIKKETLAEVFSCEFCEICKNTYSYRPPLVVASDCKKTKSQVFSCEIDKIYQNTSFTKHFEMWNLWNTM